MKHNDLSNKKTLRDEFAMAALPNAQMIARSEILGSANYIHNVVEMAYKYADEMLQQKKNHELNLCDYCRFHPATCKAKPPKFGNGKGDDNVVFCNTFRKPKEYSLRNFLWQIYFKIKNSFN